MFMFPGMEKCQTLNQIMATASESQTKAKYGVRDERLWREVAITMKVS